MSLAAVAKLIRLLKKCHWQRRYIPARWHLSAAYEQDRGTAWPEFLQSNIWHSMRMRIR